MSDLIAVAYDDRETAERVRNELAQLTREHVIEIEDAVVAAAGAAGGAISDFGVDDNFMRDLGQSLPEGSAALFVLVRRATPDKVLPRISGFGGRVIQGSLSNEAERELQEALSASGAPA